MIPYLVDFVAFSACYIGLVVAGANPWAAAAALIVYGLVNYVQGTLRSGGILVRRAPKPAPFVRPLEKFSAQEPAPPGADVRNTSISFGPRSAFIAWVVPQK